MYVWGGRQREGSRGQREEVREGEGGNEERETENEYA